MADRNKRSPSRIGTCILAGGLAVMLGMSPPAAAQDGSGAVPKETIERLEESIRKLTKEVRGLKARSADGARQRDRDAKAIQEIRDDMEAAGLDEWLDKDSPLRKFTIGGYGEMHANFGEGGSADQFDIHRLVLYLGYDFTDWITLHTETEIEHAYVSDGSGGELALEQAYVDFRTSDALSLRIGRVLTPLGIVNKTHEPPTFNGVERPSFARYIIPTTWSSDGMGVFGSPASGLSYEVYVVGGLDGSMFTAKDGIRPGRIKERPGLHRPAVTARIDVSPLDDLDLPHDQKLRVGLSTYFGGLDNANKGGNPRVGGTIHIYSADFEYSLGRFDFRGAVAHETIDGARKIGAGTAEQIFGYYLEAACHVWPEAWKNGKLKKSDAVVFVRYDKFDTQHKMPSGIARDRAGDRSEWTIGAGFYLTKNLVLKADVQIRDDATTNDLDTAINFGLGFEF